MWVQKAVLRVVPERLARKVNHTPTGTLQDSLRSRGVPFRGGSQTGVDVRLAIGDHADLERAAHGFQFVWAEPRKESRQSGTGVAAAAHDVQRGRLSCGGVRGCGGAHWYLRPVGFPAPGALAACARELQVQRGREHHTQHCPVVLHQRDIDREFAVLLDEFSRSIQRVHQPVSIPLPPLRPGRGRGFFGQDRQHGMQLRESRGNDGVCGAVRFGDR